jgi:D-threonine aldolase
MPFPYSIHNIETLDTPALVVSTEGVNHNIQTLISMIDDVKRLRPHVKTHKTQQVTRLLQAVGIDKFKCATIAEAEMLAMCQAKDVLMAYQPNSAKQIRWVNLIKKYPDTSFACLVDNLDVAIHLSKIAVENKLTLNFYIDLNVGMNRTGILPDKAFRFFHEIKSLPQLILRGIHAYDGHINSPDFDIRQKEADESFNKVEQLLQQLGKSDTAKLEIVMGGASTYPIHSQRQHVVCSPGTFVFWDKGYQTAFSEQGFEPAVWVACRVISLPDNGKVCLDLGHKSIAAENILSKRIYFPQAPDAQFIGQSEEHLVIELPSLHNYQVGDIFYGIPFHICPTCALYERIHVVENDILTGEEWQVIARDRKITC